MLSYTHFTHDERICLHNLVREGLSIRQIACRLGRSPFTISRELKRNSSSVYSHLSCSSICTLDTYRDIFRRISFLSDVYITSPLLFFYNGYEGLLIGNCFVMLLI